MKWKASLTASDIKKISNKTRKKYVKENRRSKNNIYLTNNSDEALVVYETGMPRQDRYHERANWMIETWKFDNRSGWYQYTLVYYNYREIVELLRSKKIRQISTSEEAILRLKGFYDALKEIPSNVEPV
jgi:uncharacterized phage-like protein YoqJ